MKKYLLPLSLIALVCIGQGLPPEPVATPPMPRRKHADYHQPFLMPPYPTNFFLLAIQPDGSGGTISMVPPNVYHIEVYPGETVTLSKLPELTPTNLFWMATNSHNLMLLEVKRE
jgi:hypothetical protein